MQQATNTVTASSNTGGVDRTPRESSELSLLIDVHDVAAMLKCSARHVWRLSDSGRITRPYKIGALCRWDRATIERWINDGCQSVRKGA
jgi:predicted DNA-binding transcriptional regulator AlpA